MGWQQVADAVVNRRVELGMRTRQRFAEETGLSIKTLGEIERSERISYDKSTLAIVEQALRWPAGTIAMLATDSPAPESVGAGPPLSRPVALLARLTAPDSPLDDAERAWLLRMTETMVAPFAGALDQPDPPPDDPPAEDFGNGPPPALPSAPITPPKRARQPSSHPHPDVDPTLLANRPPGRDR